MNAAVRILQANQSDGPAVIGGRVPRHSRPHPLRAGLRWCAFYIMWCSIAINLAVEPQNLLGALNNAAVQPCGLLCSSGASCAFHRRVLVLRGCSNSCHHRNLEDRNEPYNVCVCAGMGTIVKSASGKFKEGQRVTAAGWAACGSWEEYALMDESKLVRAPGLGNAAAEEHVIDCKASLALLRVHC